MNYDEDDTDAAHCNSCGYMSAPILEGARMSCHRAAEDAFFIRWYGKKYGVSAGTALELTADHERTIDAWRERNGMPACDSPLVRGFIQELIWGAK